MDRIELKQFQVREALGKVRQLGGMLVSQVMTVAPTCIPPETTALELIRLFHTKGFRHLLVIDGADRLIGVISDRDVIRCLGPDQAPDRSTLGQITAAEIMSTDLVTVSADAGLEKAVQMMIEQGISCLPVLAEESLVGILTNTDLHVVLQVLLQTVHEASLEESIAAAASAPHN
jgi:CBS domain-containing protein